MNKSITSNAFVSVQLRLRPEVADALRGRASRNHESINGLAAGILEDELIRLGDLKPETVTK